MVVVFTWSRLSATLLMGLVWFPLGILLFAGVEISVLCWKARGQILFPYVVNVGARNQTDYKLTDRDTHEHKHVDLSLIHI